MKTTPYIWKNGKFIEWEKAQTHVLTHALHYGTGVFEGIRCYKTEKGPAIFKLKEHMQRFIYSMNKLAMPLAYSEAELCHAVVKTALKNHFEEGYIRPLAYYSYGSLVVVPDEDLPVDIIIACLLWGDYMETEMIDVAISPFRRIHPKTTHIDAKLSGHYINSILAGFALRGTHFHETILLDTQGYVSEGSAENIFIVKNNKLITTPEGTILIGVTRNTIIDIAIDLGIEVIEKRFKPEAIINADEAFLCGTAVELCPIHSLEDTIIGNGKVGEITRKIKAQFQKIVLGRCPEYNDALTWVK